jgi:hypothetical protein
VTPLLEPCDEFRELKGVREIVRELGELELALLLLNFQKLLEASLKLTTAHTQ